MGSLGSSVPQFTLIEAASGRLLEGAIGQPIVRRIDDAGVLVEACMSSRAHRVLLHPENLTDRFFDLSSGEAGAILQKLRNYRIRLALVCRADVRFSSRFAEMVAEEERGDHFRVFHSSSVARDWLSGLDQP